LRNALKLVAAALAAASMVALPASAADWPQFRGPNGSGTLADGAAAPPVEIAPDKNVAWKVKLPPGASSPCVVGDRLFLTAFEDGKLFTLALSRKDGATLWKAQAPAAKIEPFHPTEGSPAASTPAADAERVVSYFGSCGLLCYDHAGKELWKVEMPCVATHGDFGTGTSPVIVDGLVILVRDIMGDSAVLAFDAKTGKPAWKADRPGTPTSYGTPIVWDEGGASGKTLVVNGGLRLTGYDPATGTQKWVIRGGPAVPCTTPVVGDGLLLFAGWSPGNEDFPLPTFDELLKSADAVADGRLTKEKAAKTWLKDFFDSNDPNKDGVITREEWEGLTGFLKKGSNAVYGVKPGGKGDITETHVAWKRTKGLPYVPSPVYHGGKLYVVRDGGLLSCLDAKTGNPAYEAQRVAASATHYASLVAAGGHLYAFALNGQLTVVKEGDKPEVVHKADFAERVKATPAIADGVLYLRTVGHLYAFGPAGK
jgi:outer membrane protein assembly factor BamB